MEGISEGRKKKRTTPKENAATHDSDIVNDNVNAEVLKTLQEKEIAREEAKLEEESCHPRLPKHCCIGSYSTLGSPSWRQDHYVCPKADFYNLPVKHADKQISRYMDMSDA